MFVVCVHMYLVCVAFILLLCHLTLYIYLLPIVSVCWLFLLCAALVGLLFLSLTWLHGIIYASRRLFHHLCHIHNFRDHFWTHASMSTLWYWSTRTNCVIFAKCFPSYKCFFSLAISHLITTQPCIFLIYLHPCILIATDLDYYPSWFSW